MVTSVPAPAPFLPCPGEPTLPFMIWRRIFESYLAVISASADGWTDARHHAILLHCLGMEEQRLFYTLPNTGTTMAEIYDSTGDAFCPES